MTVFLVILKNGTHFTIQASNRQAIYFRVKRRAVHFIQELPHKSEVL